MFSGGVGSWAAAKRVAERHGTERLTLLFTDTLIEDEDLYRFLIQGAAAVAGVGADDLAAEAARLPKVEADMFAERTATLADLAARTMARVPCLRWLADGRTVWELFFAERMMGNSRNGLCSRTLKRELADAYMEVNYSADDTTVHVGIDWSEKHRIDRLAELRAPWRYEAPMCDPPYLTKADMLRWLRKEGIRPPRLYELGFAHNNCGGFCVKAGFGHFANLLRTMPERYAFHEAKEQEFRAMVGRDDIAIMKRQPNRTKDSAGEYVPVTLKAFREEIEAGGQADMFDIGGCGCFVTEAEA
jgi:hypothetical protein